MDDNVVSIRFLKFFRGKPATCLKCGSKEVIPIIYGLPDDELIALAKQGVIECGWDVTFGGEPAWRCKSCREGFGSRSERDRRR